MFNQQPADPIQVGAQVTKQTNLWQTLMTDQSSTYGGAGSTHPSSARESACWDTPPKDNSSFEYFLILTNLQNQKINCMQ